MFCNSLAIFAYLKGYIDFVLCLSGPRVRASHCYSTSCQSIVQTLCARILLDIVAQLHGSVFEMRCVLGQQVLCLLPAFMARHFFWVSTCIGL